ncbi:hypothetical protein ACH4E7_21070 [Kitasatospora sp. NPDC018058]|uniref:hypothetical protein n=1 Tax=Kitasatospora sp. NPDC018058 TaxID=3364025 RepID=UPI0037C11B45
MTERSVRDPPVALAATEPVTLRKADLRGSVFDPVLDTMNFLDEVTLRYPDAISFALGRPYGGFFDSEQTFSHVRRYLEHLAEHEELARD